MNNLPLLMHGLAQALTLTNLAAALAGGIMGLLVGAMPGMGSLAGVSLLLPLTFKMDPTTAIIMLAALYYANMYGGSFSAILLNIPGDSPAIMTALDGYPMNKKGKAGKALFTASISSFIGGSIGIVMLTIIGPLAARFGLSFGSPELTWLIILAITSIGWLIGDSPQKGLLATALGIILATVGIDKALGQPRFSFGNVHLFSGISFIPLVIGMFGFGQVIEMILNSSLDDNNSETKKKLTIRESFLNKEETKAFLPVAIRSGFLGCFIGILPGAGATMAAFLSYIAEKRTGKNREEMGKGAIEGVAAAEAANNGAAIGAFAPLLSLGIPGSGTSAVLLGGLMMWGLQPGPLLFQNNPDFVWGLIGSMYIGNLLCLIIAIACIPFLMKIVRVPNKLMIPIISVICIMGTYSVNNSMFDVYIMIGAGLLAYFLNAAQISTAPLLLSFVLTPMFEMYIRQSFDMSSGSLSIFTQSTLSKVLMALIIIFCLSPTVIKFIKKSRGNKNPHSAG